MTSRSSTIPVYVESIGAPSLDGDNHGLVMAVRILFDGVDVADLAR
jgi:hypothetical protein